MRDLNLVKTNPHIKEQDDPVQFKTKRINLSEKIDSKVESEGRNELMIYNQSNKKNKNKKM